MSTLKILPFFTGFQEMPYRHVGLFFVPCSRKGSRACMLFLDKSRILNTTMMSANEKAVLHFIMPAILKWFPGSAAWASHRSVLEMRILRPHPKPTESDTLGVGLSNLQLNRPSSYLPHNIHRSMLVSEHQVLIRDKDNWRVHRGGHGRKDLSGFVFNQFYWGIIYI